MLLSITKYDKNGMTGPKGNKEKLVTATVFSKAQFAALLRARGSAFQCLKIAVLTHDLIVCATKGYFSSRLKVRNTCHAPSGCKSFLYKLSIISFPLFIRLPGVLFVVYLFVFFSFPAVEFWVSLNTRLPLRSGLWLANVLSWSEHGFFLLLIVYSAGQELCSLR